MKRNAQGRICRLSARGHTMYAPEGCDIVCAGISAMLQTAILGLDRVAQARPEVRMEKGRVVIAIKPRTLPADVREKADVILESTILGLQELDRSYPGFLVFERDR